MNKLLLINFLLSSIAIAQNKVDPCAHAKDETSKIVLAINQKAEIGGYEKDLDVLDDWIKACKLTDWDEKTLKNWRQESQKKKVEALVYESQFRDIKKQLPSFLKNHPDLQKKLDQGFQATAENKKSCIPADLRSELPPVKNQDGVGWCYAFAAADLLSFKTKKDISATDIAFATNNNFYANVLKNIGINEADLGGSFTAHSIKNLSEMGGACLEKDVRSDDNKFNKLIDNIRTITEYVNGAKESCVNELKSIFPNEDYSEFTKLAKDTKRSLIFEKLRSRNCSSRVDISALKIRKEMDYLRENGVGLKKPAKDLFSLIDKQLSNKNIVAISYFPTVYNRLTTRMDGGHSGTVVGRRYNDESGECEYLVRNTWGRSCDHYYTGFKCEEGNIWLPKSRLNLALKGVTYLE